jgi:hypothetical protein
LSLVRGGDNDDNCDASGVTIRDILKGGVPRRRGRIRAASKGFTT